MPIAIPGLLIATLFAAVHVFGGRLRFLEKVPRSRWLSFAGGISVAYVFVQLLPELAEHQEIIQEGVDGTPFQRVEAHVWLIALTGLSLFYCLEQFIRSRAVQRELETSQRYFWLHVSFFSIYNILIGYLLIQNEDRGTLPTVFYATALTLHLLVVDQGLRAQHGNLYHRRGRWLLAIAPVAGALLALGTQITELAIAALIAFVGGSVILNVLKEELPEDRQSRFGAFLLGAAGYSALLLLAD